MIEIVDEKFLKDCRYLLERKGISESLSEEIEYVVRKKMTAFSAKMSLNKKKVVIMRGTVKGTTYSGHPTRTTLGNTLRVISYVYYITKLAGIDWDPFTNDGDMSVFVAGDDVFGFCN